MSIDFASSQLSPETAAAPSVPTEAGQTLTLQLRVVRNGMSGRLVIREPSPAPDGVSLRMKVPHQDPLTFTA